MIVTKRDSSIGVGGCLETGIHRREQLRWKITVERGVIEPGRQVRAGSGLMTAENRGRVPKTVQIARAVMIPTQSRRMLLVNRVHNRKAGTRENRHHKA